MAPSRAIMSVVDADRLPLFPLPLVALPGEYVPLHIFEPRYRTMIAECLESGAEFGIVWLSDDELKPIGCAVVIERVLERLEDGRLNILARGTRPFELLERHDDLPYPAGTVAFLDDRPEQLDEGAARAARDVYAALVLDATDKEPEPDRLAEMCAYDMAATVEFGLEAKQGLLELRSENARLRLLARLLRAARRRLEFADRAQARALEREGPLPVAVPPRGRPSQPRGWGQTCFATANTHAASLRIVPPRCGVSSLKLKVPDGSVTT
jgi:Lon protease-like protein